MGFFKLYMKLEIIRQAEMIFSNSSSTYDQVENAGMMCFLKWYKALKRQTSLNQFRFRSFTRSVANMKPEISTLPPTENAAKQHSRRTYHQVQQWLGNEQWGWKRVGDTLEPITMEDLPAPEVL